MLCSIFVRSFAYVHTDHANAVRPFLYPFPTHMFDQVTGPVRKLAARRTR